MAILAGAFTAACSANPMMRADVSRYTGLQLCEATAVRDLTSREERDTTPGFSFHVQLDLPADCEAALAAQMARLEPAHCGSWPKVSRICFIQDASIRGPAKKHTTIMAEALGGGRYDVRFYE